MAKILTKREKKLMRKAGEVVKRCFDVLAKDVQEGVSTKSLDETANAFIVSNKARPAFLGYKGYPASICVSRNNVVVHGIPSETEMIAAGDIVSIDIGVGCDGYYADAAKTFLVGNAKSDAEKLLTVTENALYRGIEKACAGNHVSDISHEIQTFVESNGYSVVRIFVGHGIGSQIHTKPEIPNFGPPHKGCVLEDGMALAIEPMVNIGGYEVDILEDGWTAVTKDKSLSAHFEHTVIVNGKKAEIVT
ncbi:MAG: type I methionyl aminopeptidase [Candidatus Omnitrophica bacterium]|nr:type I methionyl aminopeptidase [Candidatus Omnitrophota bacterium]